ncbi:helix-turn-helix domain-containing protein [Streptomyces sp. JH34]|uniref:helix-turn-helix domain-containing protein n=1 Tax=Streptomyces sp. JH34 TaxID=2793633 RepID=UPI0023F7DCE7|nr:helix-turn-helix domain-containing protein [Streptomyces sp. JH34]MDF6020197.1 helix-turn-helix domain-containing protein [Streptomyces sp. JH34]
MYRLARTGGSPELLRRLARRAEGWAGILGGDGTVLQAAAGNARWPGHEAAGIAARAARELTARGAGSCSLDTEGCTALLLPLDRTPGDHGPVLALVAPRPLPAGLSTLMADAAMPLALAWAAESLERRRRRVDLAESRGREAVLHLLMTGQLSIAHQVAGALRPKLPDPVRVCVVECSGGQRDEVARICADVSGGRTWIVRCPVYARHLILIAPADDETDAGADEPGSRRPLGLAVAARVDDCVVGVSEEVRLPDTATAYQQAFHALAVARGLPGRHAGFGSAPEPALVVGAAGARWADTLLAPLLAHLPRRSQDPGSQELSATVASWLAFSSHATQHLKIHRNTLAARLRFVGELLGLDLNRVADQAAVDLALRIRATPSLRPRSGTPAVSGDLDTVLRAPGVQDWAVQQLRLLAGAGPTGEETLRTWLRCEARLSPAAAELGISVPGARKRLTRLEALLCRSLLQTPSARYDLWLAFRAVDLAA